MRSPFWPVRSGPTVTHAGRWLVGTPSDAGCSWLFHGSSDGSDLRMPHFFGLPAMQLLPLLALVAPRLTRAVAQRACGTLGRCASFWA